MDIFLLILKILLIIIASVIGLVLFLVLLILLWPISYQGDVKVIDELPDLRARVRYLGLLRADASFKDKKLNWGVKVLCFTILGSDKKKKEDKARSDKKAEVKETDSSKDYIITKEASKENVSAKQESEKSLDEKVTPTEKENVVIKSSEADDNKAEEKSSLSDKALGVFNKVDSFISSKSKGVEKALNIYDEEKKNVERYLKRKSTRSSFERLKNAVIKLLKHIRPRKLKGYAEIGFDDPATTGYLFAGASIIYDYISSEFELIPNFVEKKIAADFKFKGRIILGYVLVLALSLYLRKSIRRFIKNSTSLKDEVMDKANEAKDVIFSSDSLTNL